MEKKLPVNGTESSNAREAITAVSRLLPRFDGRKPVLIVEDNDANLEVFQYQLRELGLTTVAAFDGQKAVDLIIARPSEYSLVLMDLRMPDMDGLAATRLIRQHESAQGGHSVIIALTANALPGDREICMTAGMDDYIAKPVSLTTLGKILEKWLVKPEEKEN